MVEVLNRSERVIERVGPAAVGEDFERAVAVVPRRARRQRLKLRLAGVFVGDGEHARRGEDVVFLDVARIVAGDRRRAVGAGDRHRDHARVGAVFGGDRDRVGEGRAFGQRLDVAMRIIERVGPAAVGEDFERAVAVVPAVPAASG